MKIRRIQIQKINPAPYNPRQEMQPGSKDWRDLEASIQEHGLVEPLIWNRQTGNLVGGHRRLRILQHQGHQTVEVSEIDVPLEVEQRLNLRLNRVGGEFDDRKLADLFDQMPAQDLEILGWTTDELERIMRGRKKRERKDPGDQPAAGGKAVTKTGDVWTLISADGAPQHQIVCGDVLLPEVRERIHLNRPVRLVVLTAPERIMTATKGRAGRPSRMRRITDRALEQQLTAEFLVEILTAVTGLVHAQAALYCFHQYEQQRALEDALQEAGWQILDQLVIRTGLRIRPRHHYHRAHELAFYCCGEGQTPDHYGDRTEGTFQKLRDDLGQKELLALLRELQQQSTVQEPARLTEEAALANAGRSVQVIRRMIENHTTGQDRVLVPFGAGGSTLLAAEQLGRACHVIELEPKAVDAIVRRYCESFDDIGLMRNGEEQNPDDWRTTTTPT